MMVPQNTSQGQKKEHAVTAVLKTRAKTTTVLGAIAPYGVVSIKLRQISIVEQPKKISQKEIEKKRNRN